MPIPSSVILMTNSRSAHLLVIVAGPLADIGSLPA
jgi:hypothetical protein